MYLGDSSFSVVGFLNLANLIMILRFIMKIYSSEYLLM